MDRIDRMKEKVFSYPVHPCLNPPLRSQAVVEEV